MKVNDKVQLIADLEVGGAVLKAGTRGHVTKVGTDDFEFVRVEFEGQSGDHPVPKSKLKIIP